MTIFVMRDREYVLYLKMNMGMLTHPHTPNQFYASNYQIKKLRNSDI